MMRLTMVGEVGIGTLLISMLLFNTTTEVEAKVAAGMVPQLKVTMNPSQHDAQLVSSTTYFNGTTYHIKGVIRNMNPESSDLATVTMQLEDKASGNVISEKIFTAGGPSDVFGVSHISPGATFPFDADTGFMKNETNQLQHVYVVLTV
jgi:hypothetical protein